jgi:hypothetical protein
MRVPAFEFCIFSEPHLCCTSSILHLILRSKLRIEG